jgi:hypothetical protein
MTHVANVHVEHLPAGRYGAIPDSDSRPEIGLSIDKNSGQTKLTHGEHHLLHRHGYHSVDQVSAAYHFDIILTILLRIPSKLIILAWAGCLQYRNVQLFRLCLVRNACRGPIDHCRSLSLDRLIQPFTIMIHIGRKQS